MAKKISGAKAPAGGVDLPVSPETSKKRRFDDRHESTKAYIDYLRPRCEQLARVLKKTGSFYYHCDWHASHYVKVMPW